MLLPPLPVLSFAALLSPSDSIAAEYARLKASMENERARYHAAWNRTPERRDSVPSPKPLPRFAKAGYGGGAAKCDLIAAARAYLLERITKDMFPLWYGTPWDFNGTTRTPRQGRIACGYFVNTVLQDAGFRIPRVKWSQLAAEPMIRKMAPTARAFSGAAAETVLAHPDLRDDGLYAVGLDNHVGFLWKHGGRTLFVHADYYDPATGVKAEPALGDNPFAHSRYRVVGRLLNDAMVERWITGATWE